MCPKTWFRILGYDGHFDNASESDLITMAVIHLPIIWEQVEHFAHLWNIHSIRKQHNRRYLIAGKPVLNYFHAQRQNPDVEYRGMSCDPVVLQRLQDAVHGYSISFTLMDFHLYML
jgi:hypothetical protein